MPKAKTNEEFIQDLMAKSPSIEPLEPYKGNRINIKCRCIRCGNEWYIRPGNLLSGKGCPVCAIQRNASRRMKSNEEFIIELRKKNHAVLALQEYQGANAKILFKCNFCSHEWVAKTSHILAGHGCPRCGGSMKKEHDEFIAEIEKINPHVEILGEYQNAKAKILCRCKFCLNEWNGTPDKLLQGNGCPHCDKRNKTSFPEQAFFFYLKKAYPDATSRYYMGEEHIELDIYIPSVCVAIEYDGVYWHANKEEAEIKKYQKCKDNGITLYRVREFETYDESIADKIFVRKKPYRFETLDASIQQLLSELNINLPVNTYSDSIQIRELFYNNLKANSLQHKFPALAAYWHPTKNGKILPIMVSFGCNEKFWWKCPTCQYEWETSVCSMTRAGREGCPKCKKSQIADKLRKTNEQFISELADANPNIRVLEEYKSFHTNILFHCNTCGNEWPATPANILRGRDCPVCSHKRRIEKMTKTKRAKSNRSGE